MKNTYPIVLIPDQKGYTVYIPDFDIYTQGADLTESIAMARDAIGLMGIDMEDDKKELPVPCCPAELTARDGEIISLVDVDFSEYRRKQERRTVRKNVSLPSWLNFEADRAGLNVSAVLQEALKRELNIQDRP